MLSIGLCVASACVGTAVAQCDIAPIAQLGGELGDTVVHDAAAYVAQRRSGIAVRDISDPTQPTIITRLDAERSELACEGSLLCAAGSVPGVTLFDTSTPLAPELLVEIATPWTATDVLLYGGIVYAITEDATIGRVDVRDPQQPVLLTDLSGVSRAVDLAATDDLLCVARGGFGLVLVNISDPLDPLHVGSHATDSDLVAAAPGVVYSVDSHHLRCFDLSDPEHPTIVWSDIADVPSLSVDLAASGSVLAWSNRDEPDVWLYDISAPLSPERFGAVGADARVDRLCLSGDRLIGSDTETDTWQIVDTGRDRPSSIASYWSLGLVEHIERVGDRVFLFSAGHLHVYEVSPEGALTRLVRWNHGSTPTQFWTDGQTLAAADGFALKVLDVSDPMLPTLLGTTGLPGRGSVIAVRDHVAYVGMTEGGIALVDLSSPDDPVVLEQLPLVGAVSQLCVSGDTLAAGTDQASTVFFDVTDPLSPEPIATLLGTSPSRSASMDGGLFVTAASDGSVDLYDISTPGSPSLVSRLLVRYQDTEVSLADGRLFVGHRGGMEWWDVTTPGSPVQIGSCDRLHQAASIRVAGDFAVMYSEIEESSQGVLATISVAEPSGPALLSIEYTPQHLDNLVVQSEHLLATTPYAVVDIDISTPDQPRVLGGIPGMPSSVDIGADESYAYLRSENQFSVLQRTEEGWRVVGTLTDPDRQVRLMTSMEVVPGLVFLSGSRNIVVIDTSNPAAPAILSRFDVPWSGAGMLSIDGETAGIVNESARRINFLDVRNPADIQTISELHLNTWGPRSILVDGDIAYVATDQYAHFMVVGISEPSSPEILLDTSQFGPVKIAQKHGNFLIVVGERVMVLDVANPLQPSVEYETTPMDSRTYAAAVKGDSLYLSGGLSPALAVYEFLCACPADFDHDDIVDTRDVIAFLNAWSAGDSSSDIDENGVIDTRDFIAFLNLWNTGC